MEKIIIQGGHSLKGEIHASGAKNSILPLLFSCLLANGKHVFHNVPRLSDVHFSCNILKSFGCSISFSNNTLTVEVKNLKKFSAPYNVVRKMRASILCLGPLLSRYGKAKVSLPGGCAIGSRPINFHLDALHKLGAKINLHKGNLETRCPGTLKGAFIRFKKKSVGATENLIMAATLADGETVIENVSEEPEIEDLISYLTKMGAKIKKPDTHRIIIQGVNKLRSAEHTVIPDRIETGTLLIAGAITKGEVTVTHCEPKHLTSFLKVLGDIGFKIHKEKTSLTIYPSEEWKPYNIETSPYPGFPTDLQAQFMSLCTEAKGKSEIFENVFENRFMHVQELLRMNAKIKIDSAIAMIHGEPNCLKSAPVMATDLRASASLILAGLKASGETEIQRIYHLDRGYEKLEHKISKLGAKIKRIKNN